MGLRMSLMIKPLLGLGSLSLALSACDVYEGVTPPSEFESAGLAAGQEQPPEAAAPSSDAEGAVTYKLAAKATTPIKLSASSSGKAGGVYLEFAVNSLPQDLTVTIEPATALPYKQLRTEVGAPGEISALGAAVFVGATPAVETLEPFAIFFPLDAESAAAGARGEINVSILALANDLDTKSARITLLSPNDYFYDKETGTISIRTTRFGVYALVKVAKKLTERLERPSTRSPEKFSFSNAVPELKLKGLPGSEQKKSESDSEDDDRSFAAPTSNKVALDVNVDGDGISEYRYVLGHDQAHCDGLTLGAWTAKKQAITDKLGENGIKVLCVQGRTAKGRESPLVPWAWKKNTTAVSLKPDSTTGYDFSSTATKTVTLTVEGKGSVYDIAISDMPDYYGFAGGSFPGTSGTCKAASEDKSCTVVLEFKGTGTGKFMGIARLSYFDGADTQQTFINLTATK